MKKLNLLLTIGAFALGMGFNSFAMSNIPSKIAVIDVNKVINQSSQVIALKKEQNIKNEELRKLLITARADIEKQTAKEAKEKLIKKYDADFNKKKSEVQKNYTKKLQEIDKNISAAIAQTAKERGYEIVLSKNAVLYGGDDITGTISKLIK